MVLLVAGSVAVLRAAGEKVEMLAVTGKSVLAVVAAAVAVAAAAVALNAPVMDAQTDAESSANGWNSCTEGGAEGVEVLVMMEGGAGAESSEGGHSVLHAEELDGEALMEVRPPAAHSAVRLEAHAGGLAGAEGRSLPVEVVMLGPSWDSFQPPWPSSRDYCVAFVGTGNTRRPCPLTGTRRYTGLGEYSHPASFASELGSTAAGALGGPQELPTVAAVVLLHFAAPVAVDHHLAGPFAAVAFGDMRLTFD